jgi:hypothetical protein
LVFFKDNFKKLKLERLILDDPMEEEEVKRVLEEPCQ